MQVKIYSSVKPPIVKIICDEAHRLGLTVTGHIPIGMTLMQGVDSGMDMINHVQYVFSVLKKKPDYSIDFNDSHVFHPCPCYIFKESFPSLRRYYLCFQGDARSAHCDSCFNADRD